MVLSALQNDPVLDEHCLRHLGTRLSLARILLKPSTREQLDSALSSVHGAEASSEILDKVDTQILAAHLDTHIREFDSFLSGAGRLNLKSCLDALPDYELFELEEEDAYIFLGVAVHCAIYYLLKASNVEKAWHKARDLVRKGERIEESERITFLRARGVEILKSCAKEGAHGRTKEMAIKASDIEKELSTKSLLKLMRDRANAVLADLKPLWKEVQSQSLEIPETGNTETQPPETYEMDTIIEEEEVAVETKRRVTRSGHFKSSVEDNDEEIPKSKDLTYEIIPETQEPLDLVMESPQSNRRAIHNHKNSIDEGDTAPINSSGGRKRRISLVNPTNWQANDDAPVSKVRRLNDDPIPAAEFYSENAPITESESREALFKTPIRSVRKARPGGLTPRSNNLTTPLLSNRTAVMVSTKGKRHIAPKEKRGKGPFSKFESDRVVEGLNTHGWGEWALIARNFFQQDGCWRTTDQVRTHARMLERKYRRTTFHDPTAEKYAEKFPVHHRVNRYGPAPSVTPRPASRKKAAVMRLERDSEDEEEEDAIEAFDDTQEDDAGSTATDENLAKKSTPVRRGPRRSLLDVLNQSVEDGAVNGDVNGVTETEVEQSPRVLRRSTRNVSSPKDNADANGLKEDVQANVHDAGGETKDEPRTLRRSTRHESSPKDNADANGLKEDEQANVQDVEGETKDEPRTLRRSTRHEWSPKDSSDEEVADEEDGKMEKEAPALRRSARRNTALKEIDSKDDGEENEKTLRRSARRQMAK